MWLNVDEQRTDWLEILDQLKFQDSITLDESMKRKPTSTSGCPVMKLQKLDNSDLISAMITSGDCEEKARFLCSLDLSKPTKVHTKPNFSCLQPKKSASKDGEKINGRKKRHSNIETNEKIYENKESKIFAKISIKLC